MNATWSAIAESAGGRTAISFLTVVVVAAGIASCPLVAAGSTDGSAPWFVTQPSLVSCDIGAFCAVAVVRDADGGRVSATLRYRVDDGPEMAVPMTAELVDPARSSPYGGSLRLIGRVEGLRDGDEVRAVVEVTDDTENIRWSRSVGAIFQEDCVGGATNLCLNGNRFRVEVAWTDFQGVTGFGEAVPLSDDTGYFWFFDSANVELVVKVLDGTGINGHFWVFYGALSNVAYTLRLTDTETGQVKEYTNPLGTFASVGDVEALEAGLALAFGESGGLEADYEAFAVEGGRSSGAVVARRTVVDRLPRTQPAPTRLQPLTALPEVGGQVGRELSVPYAEEWVVEAIELQGAELGDVPFTVSFHRAAAAGGLVEYRATVVGAPAAEAGSTTLYLDRPAVLPPGVHRLVVHSDGDDRGLAPASGQTVLRGKAVPAMACTGGQTALCLNGDRYRVEVEWMDFEGGTGLGQAVPLSGDTGYFWFFDDANVELVVKVLDARGVNGYFWVFYGSLSNVEYTMTITDTETGRSRVYFNPLRNFASRGDVRAFLADPPGADQVRGALEQETFVADSVVRDSIESPVLVVGSFTGGDGMVSLIEREVACRGFSHDAVFHLPVQAGSGHEGTGRLTNRLIRGLNALADVGVRNVLVVGHNTGGLVARAAVADRDGGGSSLSGALNLELLTLFTPFAGVTDEDMRPAYPASFNRGSDLIENPGSLPGNVSHTKVDGSMEGDPNNLEGPDDTDALFFDSQAHPVVDSDPRLTLQREIGLQNWLLDIDVRLGEVFDSIGDMPSRCSGTEVAPGEAGKAGGQHAPVSFGRAAGKVASEIPYDPAPFAAKGLTLMNPGPVTGASTIDPNKPITVIVHGFDFDLQKHTYLTNLARELIDAGENVFLFQYDQENENLDQAAERLGTAVRYLYMFFMREDMTVIGHSMGGLVARKSMIRGSQLDGMPLVLVTVASPFAGYAAANWAPDAVIAFGWGEVSTQMASGNNFILNPGLLPDSVQHIKVVTREEGHAGDNVASLERQRNSTVDDDRQLRHMFTVDAGHTGVFRSDLAVENIIGAFHAARGFVPQITGEDDDPGTPQFPEPTQPLQINFVHDLGTGPCPKAAGTVTITNRGELDFVWRMNEDDSANLFTVSRLSGTLAPGESHEIEVEFHCEDLPADQGPTFRYLYLETTFTAEDGRVESTRVNVQVDIR